MAAGLDALGNAFFKTPRKRGPQGRFQKALVIRLDHLGDVLLSTGVPKALKEALGEARVSVLVSSRGSELFLNNPFVDEIILYDAPWFWPRREAKTGFWELRRTLSARHFNLGLSLRGDLRENFLLFAAGVRERVGYGITGGGFFLTREVDHRPRGHETEHLKDLLAAAGAPAGSYSPEIFLTDAERKAFQMKTAEWGIGPDKPLIGFQIGAGTPSKEWPAQHVRAFFKEAPGRFPEHSIVLTGAEREAARFREIFPGGAPGPQVIDLIGRLSLREFCLLAAQFKFFVGPDSGPTHIASALGAPSMFLFSGTNELERWKPLAESARVLRREVPCAPCGLKVCGVKGHPCMELIRPDEVLKDLEEAMR
jgi:ADP-heptose:LPS heptosyltransferase